MALDLELLTAEDVGIEVKYVPAGLSINEPVILKSWNVKTNTAEVVFKDNSKFSIMPVKVSSRCLNFNSDDNFNHKLNQLQKMYTR
jgi:hypothetical protein